MKPHRCKFCGERVDLNVQGVTYADNTCAHEECHDAAEWQKENAGDLERD